MRAYGASPGRGRAPLPRRLRADHAAGHDGPPAVDAAIDGNPATTARVTVIRGGAAAGTITSDPAGIDCGAACVGDFTVGTLVTLTATPAVGAVFAGWGGACSGGCRPARWS